MKRQLAGVTLLALCALQGCKTGYNRTDYGSSGESPPDCATAPANSSLNDQSLKVFNLIAGLTCASSDYQDGYIVGQSLGFGNQLDNPASLEDNDPNNHSYGRLVTDLATDSGHTPGIIAIDYEGEQLYTETELLDANKTLKEHWDDGGLVSISWTPLSPWQIDLADIEGNRGSPDDSEYPSSDDIDLRDLTDNTTDVHTVWNEKLEAMAVALKDLQDKGVTVLWRPLPEMNRDTFWWGTKASDPADNTEKGQLYIDLWENMFEFFKEQGINNLLWVYSPGESTGDHTITWAYPGDDYVDVVAGIAHNVQLTIKDYKAMVDLGRPVAMAEYGPDPTNNLVLSSLTDASKRGGFDNTAYVDRLKGGYPSVAYWVTPHSDVFETNQRSNLALVDNKESKALMSSKLVISRERLEERKMRE